VLIEAAAVRARFERAESQYLGWEVHKKGPPTIAPILPFSGVSRQYKFCEKTVWTFTFLSPFFTLPCIDKALAN
jgi:hypothetical protein